MVEYNTIILGAGISGISCAIYLKRAGINTLIVENYMPGGQLNKANVIENYPGFVSISGSDLSTMLLEQVQNYNIDMIYEEVNNIDYDNKIITIGDVKYSYKYLVFATGRREKTLGLENEDKLIGRGISLCATCDGALYKEKKVAVVGGGSSAVSEAIYLANMASRVYLIYRGSELRAEEILKDRLIKFDNVEVIYENTINNYLLENDKLNGICLSDGRAIKVDCVFLAIGHLPNSELFVGNKTDGYIEVDEYGETSIVDVYACGDVINKGVYQLVTASGDGVLVANSIIRRNQLK